MGLRARKALSRGVCSRVSSFRTAKESRKAAKPHRVHAAPSPSNQSAMVILVEQLDSEKSNDESGSNKDKMRRRKKGDSGGSDSGAKEELFHWVKKGGLVPLVELVFAGVTTFALLGAVDTTTEVDARSELGADFEGGVLHHANKYGKELKKVKPIPPLRR